MDATRTKITLDDLDASAIAVRIKALPENTDISAVFPTLYEHGVALIVDSKGYLARMISDVRLDHDDPVLIDCELVCLPKDSTVREIRYLLQKTSQKLIPLLDHQGRYTGYCASRNELMKVWAGQFEMPRIGGLATPLGVYLTTGVHTTGAGTYGLILTGISFAIFVTAARFFWQYMSHYYWWMKGLNDVAQMAVVFGILLILIRLSPLSGFHAAEHQTIHVIEKGLPLTPENVYAQPRAHHRCGTNVMVGMVGLEMAYIGATSIQPMEYAMIFLVVWMSVLILGWKYLGTFLQVVFTTAKPHRYQVENAIKAGKQMIEKYRMRPHSNPNIWQRIWGSGMLQIFFSFFFASWLFQQLIDIIVEKRI